MIRFGQCSVDVAGRVLERDGEEQHVEPQAFDLLAYLIDNADRVVPKSELLDEVWGDQFVSESALTTRIKEIRKAVGDDGKRQEVIRNSRGRGYRFVAALSEPTPAVDPAITSTPTRRRRPPPPPTPSVGLDEEINRLAELTGTKRLVTIVGPGGVGKTRLAQEVGRVVADRHALGTRVVELSRVGEAAAVNPTIRRALDLSEGDSDVADGLGAVDTLLVLDNCEHVVDAVAAAMPDLVTGGESLHVLATSREPLGVPGEQRWVLAPLSTVGPEAPAVTLFRDRAREVGTEVDPTDPLGRSIVADLDGIPLAIEMAAARLATMGLADLADELARSVASLRSGHRGVAERHSTLRSVVAWSESLLTEDQRSVLADFSVFAGPVEAGDLPGAVDAPSRVDAVCALAERSLVTVDTTIGDHVRYGSLGTVRELGRERLWEQGRLDLVRRRHAEWFTDAAEEAAETYDTAGQHDAAARIDGIFDELRAAHVWSREHDRSLAIRLSHALFQPAFQELRLEIVEWSLALVDVVGPDGDGAVQLYGEVAMGLALLGRIGEARQWAERSIDLASDPHLCRAAYGVMGDVTLYTGELERSEEYARRFDALVEEAGTRIERAYGRASLALPIAYQGRHDEALALIPVEPPQSDPPIARGWLAYARGEVLLDMDPDAALRELNTAIELAETVNGHFLSGVAHVSAASLRARTGQADDAVAPLARTIERLAERGNATQLVTTLRNVPPVLARLEEWQSSAEILGGLSTTSIRPTYGDEADRLATAEEATRSALGEEDFTRARRAGGERTLDQTARRAVSILDGFELRTRHR